MRPTAPTDPPAGLRSALTGGFVMVPGCHDPLSARLAAEAGAAAVFLAGSPGRRALFDAPSVPRGEARTHLRYVELVCRAAPLPELVRRGDRLRDPLAACADRPAAGA